MTALAAPTRTSKPSLAERYHAVRRFSRRLVETLSAEDCAVQSMPDASPAKWHLAHTTWFFETFLLLPRVPGYRSPCDAYAVLFNSYYNTVGEQYPRPRRGLLSRPSFDETLAYRRSVDAAMADWLAGGVDGEGAALVEVGLNHEQQHQELLVTDIKHALSVNPLEPAYRPERRDPASEPTALTWTTCEGGVVEVGHDPAAAGFAFDNEGPRHEALVIDHELADRPVTCGEYREFIADGGYQTPTLWLSEGWATVERERWTAPLYWRQDGPDWSEYTTAGRTPIDPAAPVTHLSYFEADAYARWAGARLPTETEWEVACQRAVETGVAIGPTAESRLSAGAAIHPAAVTPPGNGPQLLLGGVWEWTASPYTPYPGYRPAAGALGEYNGKFMVNQQVLRGGSCATPSLGHLRPTYRNFFGTAARWQFSGVRLAR